MSIRVYAAKLQADALSKLIADLRARPGYAILERPDKLKFAGPSEEIDCSSWPVGHAFDSQVELYWEKDDAEYSVRVACVDIGEAPHGFREVLALDGAEKSVWYYLWGEDDKAVGGRLKYSQAITGPGRGQLRVAEYRDEEGRLVFYRYLELRREASDG